jgi:hypothetical protein
MSLASVVVADYYDPPIYPIIAFKFYKDFFGPAAVAFDILSVLLLEILFCS